ncbi:hypothetical protein [Brevibacillus reuszeri]|uniref:hypothetical protein n=1 Tax=Brevibacillus reuszeri TaxID=54915 RepID=UPI0013DEEC8D|nr:hypothetical protein [Brevibacillus reuszeri]
MLIDATKLFNWLNEQEYAPAKKKRPRNDDLKTGIELSKLKLKIVHEVKNGTFNP